MNYKGAIILEKSEHIERGERYEPKISEDERHSLIEQWKRAVKRSQKWVE